MSKRTPRPAESITGVAGAIAALCAYLFQIDEPTVVVALTIVIGAIPALVTWTVETLKG